MLSENVERSKIIKLTWYLLSFFSKKKANKLFLKRADSKYFRSYRPWGLCFNYSAALYQCKSSQYLNEWEWIQSVKLDFQNWQLTHHSWPSPSLEPNAPSVSTQSSSHSLFSLASSWVVLFCVTETLLIRLQSIQGLYSKTAQYWEV